MSKPSIDDLLLSITKKAGAIQLDADRNEHALDWKMVHELARDIVLDIWTIREQLGFHTHENLLFETPHGSAWCNKFGVFLYNKKFAKPTKNQKWWMKAILNGREATQSGLMRAKHGRYVFKIHHRSLGNAVEKGWIEFRGGLTYLTSTGKEALED